MRSPCGGAKQTHATPPPPRPMEGASSLGQPALSITGPSAEGPLGTQDGPQALRRPSVCSSQTAALGRGGGEV